MSEAVKSIVLIGVGGQGTILVSNVLTSALVAAGYDVKMSEIHGMAQRGGSVSTQIRYGQKVYSPLIGAGEADLLLAFERMEAVRGAAYLKEDALIIVNDYAIVPPPVASGKASYPDNCIEALSNKFKVISFNAARVAEELGNSRVMNVVLLGAMAEVLQLDSLDWDTALKENVPELFIETNQKAFKRGRELARSEEKAYEA
ncbi:MAG: indolepyruvate oxidoreductase subunit beta [Eubacteriales bacterium]|nr:indolepyruvate oxidoreductase subunit beta [Eubacteriales bacterium]MDD4324614.1 indolepyruvate oxidoreductase subunit beta [Eubacteriales bacterium]MDD4540795.1 indolepyruvate oxidoreductase subunit beta [Eubacteriales bacterium]